VAEENYSITRTFYQIRKKNYIINCDFIQDVLGPMMRSPKLARTDADIKVAVRAWANPATRATAEITYGHISDWETSQVTNMEKLICGNTNRGGDAKMQSFNDDISRWDTSNVTTMANMFINCPIETKHKPPRCRLECNKEGNDKQGQKRGGNVSKLYF
jgi:surface protein